MSKSKRLPALSDSQLEIMQVVWEGHEVTVSQVWKALSKRRQVARNTVLTLMERLAKKGWLKRRAEGHLHHYSAAVSRERTLGDLVSGLLDRAFAGSAEHLMVALVDARGLTEEEARRIREIIRDARKAEP